MSNRSAIGKVLRLLHISAALRLVFVLFALGLGLIPAAADNVAGLELGRQIAEYSWPKYQAYFNGTAGGAADIPVNASSVGGR